MVNELRQHASSLLVGIHRLKINPIKEPVEIARDRHRGPLSAGIELKGFLTLRIVTRRIEIANQRVRPRRINLKVLWGTCANNYWSF